MSELIYPKQLLNFKNYVVDKQCFFIMPFADDYRNLYSMIKVCLENEGYQCVRVDDNQEGAIALISMILKGIVDAQFIIVDISDKNANVFYELGIAHVIKDMDNVFIIKNKDTIEPFDIRHLQYIKYDQNNLMDLCTKLLKRLNSKQYKSSFGKAVTNSGVVNSEDADLFVSYLDSLISDKKVILKFVDFLNTDSLTAFNGDEMDAIILFREIIIKETYSADVEKHLTQLFQLYFRLLLTCYSLSGVDELVSEFLKCDNFGILRTEMLRSYQTDLAILFATKQRLTDICMNWIIDYFQRSKSTKVDLNRYKLESFLMSSESDVVNSYISNAIVSENKYIREHMADIAGEKQLSIAYPNLKLQLNREENVFAASSIMEALGKLKQKEAISLICNWIHQNENELVAKDDIFVIKHARNAIRRIDVSSQDSIAREFELEYLPLLIKYNMC